MKRVLCLFLIISLIHSLRGQNSSSLEQVGTSMANFLKVGVGARALAMGDASVALCDDITALYWNPGALDRSSGNELLFQQNNWLVDTKIYYFGASYKLRSFGTVGVSFHVFSSGDIEETTLLEPDGTGRTFSADDFAAGLTYSKMITDRFSTGVSVKLIQESLANERARTVAIDIGSVFETSFLNNLRIGMALSNLGGQMKLSGSDLSIQYATNPDYPTKVIRAELSTDEWDIPLLFRFGVATEILKNETHRLTLSSEIMDSRDFLYRLAFGGEWALRELIFLRGGYKFNTDEDHLTLGGGVKFNLLNKNMRLDYAYSSFGVFDYAQRFSFIFAF